MANLSVEGLNQVIQSGDVEKLFSRAMDRMSRSESVAPGAGGVDGAPGLSPPGVSQSGNDATGASSGKTFGDILQDSMDKVNLYQHQSDHSIKELIAGRAKNIHETLLTIERADTSLKMMLQVRNKILDAYREVMRMQV
jgi:flagellar hook-basal body complex protein FliE